MLARTLVDMSGTASQPADQTPGETPDADLSGLRAAVIGAGNMGGPVVRAFLAAGVAASNLRISNSTPASSERAAKELGVTAAAREDALAGADVVVLGVKPHQILEVLGECREQIPADAVVISLAAGITLDAMEQALPAGQPVLRAMPNTPISVGEGAVGIMHGANVDGQVLELVHTLFSQAGVAVDITEDQVHAFIGAAGSLSGFVFYAIEAMTDEAVRQGLTHDLASTLVQQTVRGAATMLIEGGTHPAIARNGVASPGGTTVQGYAALDRAGVRAGLAAAMDAAASHSRAMTGN